MMRKKLVVLLAGMAFVSAGAFAQDFKGSIKTPSDASVVVLVTPLLLGGSVIGSGHAAANASMEGSAQLNGTTGWTVGAVRDDGAGGTELDLLRDDQAVRQTIRLDKRVVTQHGLTTGANVTIKQTGKRSFVLKRGEAILSPLSFPQAGLTHSKARE